MISVNENCYVLLPIIIEYRSHYLSGVLNRTVMNRVVGFLWYKTQFKVGVTNEEMDKTRNNNDFYGDMGICFWFRPQICRSSTSQFFILHSFNHSWNITDNRFELL